LFSKHFLNNCPFLFANACGYPHGVELPDNLPYIGSRVSVYIRRRQFRMAELIEAGAYYLTNRQNIFLNKTHAYRRKQLLIILFYLISGIYGIAIIGPEFASNLLCYISSRRRNMRK